MMTPLQRYSLLFFLLLHIPTSLLVDFQALGLGVHSDALHGMNQWYYDLAKDFLMSDPPIWFKSLIGAELLLQVPYHICASYALLKGEPSFNWIRIPTIMWGAHTATTLIPILGELIYSDKATESTRWILVSLYTPYMVIPAYFMMVLAMDPHPFGLPTGKKLR
ncbi:unnamed protein product [Chrysoparadoxa australica]